MKTKCPKCNSVRLLTYFYKGENLVKCRDCNNVFKDSDNSLTEAPKDHPDNITGNMKVIME